MLDIDALRLRFRVMFIPTGKTAFKFHSSKVHEQRNFQTVITLTEGKRFLFTVWMMKKGLEANDPDFPTFSSRLCWPHILERGAMPVVKDDIDLLFENFTSGQWTADGITFNQTDYVMMRLVFSGD